MNAGHYIRTVIILRQMRNNVQKYVSIILKIQGYLAFCVYVKKLFYKKVFLHITSKSNNSRSPKILASSNDVILNQWDPGMNAEG